MSWIAYLKVVSPPIPVKNSIAYSVISTSSSSHLVSIICRISSLVYGFVWMISSLSSKSKGIPCGLWLLTFLPFVVGTTDVCDSSVCSQNYNRCSFTFKGSVEEGKAFHIKHVDLINKKDSRNNFSLTFLSPFCNLLINLFSNFLGNFTGSTWKQSQKSLGTRVNDINFMKTHSMNDFFSFFNLAFGTVHKSGLRSHSIIIRCPCEASSCFGNFSWSFIDCDDISSDYFLFLNCLNHFLT